MKLIFGADLVPTNSNEELFISGDIDKIVDDGILSVMSNADYRIFNLETALTDNGLPITKCGPNIKASPLAINGIKNLNPSLVLLSNNHVLDYGEAGLEDTVKTLDSNGIEHIGAAENLKKATETYIFEKDGVKIGIYNCCEYEFSIAGENSWGANPFDPLESLDHISELKEKCDYVIVVYHGGKEHYRYPSPNLKKRCRKIVEKGADAVLCQHSHCIGSFEDYRGSKIIYGQGNFIFAPRDEMESWNTSLLVEITINNGLEFEFYPICCTQTGARTADAGEKEEILKNFYKRSEQIKDNKFVEDKYSEFCESMINEYLNIMKGIHWSEPEKMDPNLKDTIDMNIVTSIYNYYLCEAHSEVILRALENKIKD